MQSKFFDTDRIGVPKKSQIPPTPGRHGRRRAPSANRRVQVLPLCSTVFCALLHTRSLASDVASVSRPVGGFLDEVPSQHKKCSCPTRDRFERLSLAAVLVSWALRNAQDRWLPI